MANVHSKSLRKLTGGLRRAARKKKKFELSRPHLPVTVGTEKRKIIRVQGGNIKQRLLKAEFVVVSDGAKTRKVKITDVVENAANPFFIRRNIITKGAVVNTEAGYARVTSRPGQHGTVNAVILKDYEPLDKKKAKKKKLAAQKLAEAATIKAKEEQVADERVKKVKKKK